MQFLRSHWKAEKQNHAETFTDYQLMMGAQKVKRRQFRSGMLILFWKCMDKPFLKEFN